MFTSQEFVKQISNDQNNSSIICIGSSNSLAAEKTASCMILPKEQY